MDKAAAEAFIQRRHAVFLRLLTIRSIIKVLQAELDVTLAEVEDPSVGDTAKDFPEITSRVVEACHHLGIDMDLPGPTPFDITGPVASTSGAASSSTNPVTATSSAAASSAGPVASTSNTTLNQASGDDSDSDESIHWSREHQIEVLGMTEAEYHSA